MYCADMLTIALELAQHNIAYEDIASKFLENFMQIAHSALGGSALLSRDDDGVAEGRGPAGTGLWHDGDGWYYDILTTPGTPSELVRLRSIVGLIPLLATCVIEERVLARLPAFRARMEWFTRHRSHFTRRHHITVSPAGVSVEQVAGQCGGDSRGRRRSSTTASPPERTPTAAKSGRHLLSFVALDQLPRILGRMLDEEQFLSPHGIRSLSKEHRDAPFHFRQVLKQDLSPPDMRLRHLQCIQIWRP